MHDSCVRSLVIELVELEKVMVTRKVTPKQMEKVKVIVNSMAKYLVNQMHSDCYLNLERLMEKWKMTAMPMLTEIPTERLMPMD